MNEWPVGISTGCFYRSNVRKHLQTILDGGFRVLEISSSPSHIDVGDLDEMRSLSRFCTDRGVEIFSLHAPFAYDIDITSPDRRERLYSHRRVMQSLDAALQLGARCFVLHPWPERDHLARSPERKERVSIVTDFVHSLTRRCNACGIALALENMQPHQLISPLRDLLWIRKETEEEHIAACFDTGHAAITGNLPLVLRELSGHITIVHAHDNHGGGDDHLLPGEGGIDWPKLIHELLTSGFQGPFIIELNDTPEVRPATVIEGAIRARNYLERIIAEQVPTLSDRATY